MKQTFKIGLSLLLLSSLALAGGKGVVVTEDVVIEIPYEAPFNHFYIGLGLNGINFADDSSEETLRTLGATLKVGYQYNEYIAIEGRYTQSVGDVAYDKGTTAGPNISNYPSTISNMSIYLKPSYRLGDFELYGLLGYGQTKVTDLPTGTIDRTEDSFSWGIGVDYAITDNISTFIDYTRPYQEIGFDGHVPTSDIHIDLITIGVSYKF